MDTTVNVIGTDTDSVISFLNYSMKCARLKLTVLKHPSIPTVISRRVSFRLPPVTLGGWWDTIWKGHHGCCNYISRPTDMHIHIQPLGLSECGTFRSRNKINGNDLWVWHICLMGKLKLTQLLGLLEDTSIQCSLGYSQIARALRLFSRASLASASQIGPGLPQWHSQEVDLRTKKPELPSFSHSAESK